MKHLVFILDGYYPWFSAVGNCAHQVIHEIKNDYRITVIAMQNDISLSDYENYDGYDIFRISTIEMQQRNALNEKIKKFNKKIDRLLLYALRLKGAVKKILSRQNLNQNIINAYVDKLHDIRYPIDTIIPLVIPFESVIAALNYKKEYPKVKVMPYLFDLYAAHVGIHVVKVNRLLKFRRHLELEELMIKSSNFILAMHFLEKHFTKYFHKLINGKFVFLEHPLLVQYNFSKNSQNKNEKVVFTYTGSLLKNIREPSYLFKLLDCLRIDDPIEIHFYIMGNCSDIVDQYEKRNPVFINHGYVPKEIVNIAMEKSDIFLSIGDVEGTQISSKIFEYMSTGKPIIHLSYVKDDVVVSILKKYPLSLCLMQKEELFLENSKRLNSFIRENKTRRLPFKIVKDIFPEAIPKTTADIIREIVG